MANFFNVFYLLPHPLKGRTTTSRRMRHKQSGARPSTSGPASRCARPQSPPLLRASPLRPHIPCTSRPHSASSSAYHWPTLCSSHMLTRLLERLPYRMLRGDHLLDSPDAASGPADATRVVRLLCASARAAAVSGVMWGPRERGSRVREDTRRPAGTTVAARVHVSRVESRALALVY